MAEVHHGCLRAHKIVAWALACSRRREEAGGQCGADDSSARCLRFGARTRTRSASCSAPSRRLPRKAAWTRPRGFTRPILPADDASAPHLGAPRLLLAAEFSHSLGRRRARFSAL